MTVYAFIQCINVFLQYFTMCWRFYSCHFSSSVCVQESLFTSFQEPSVNVFVGGYLALKSYPPKYTELQKKMALGDFIGPFKNSQNFKFRRGFIWTLSVHLDRVTEKAGATIYS